MPAKACVSSMYRWRLLVMAGIFLIFGPYFLYDGYVGFPAKREMNRTFKQMALEERMAEWPALAKERGWPEDTEKAPGKDYGNGDILAQKIIGYPVTFVGLLFLFSFVRFLGRWIASDGQVITASDGTRFTLAEITELNLGLWKKKGIAVVHYRAGHATRVLVLDDWKYERAATTQIVEEIQEHLRQRGVMPVGAEAPAAPTT